MGISNLHAEFRGGGWVDGWFTFTSVATFNNASTYVLLASKEVIPSKRFHESLNTKECQTKILGIIEFKSDLTN
jgi:hypothetical protein